MNAAAAPVSLQRGAPLPGAHLPARLKTLSHGIRAMVAIAAAVLAMLPILVLVDPALLPNLMGEDSSQLLSLALAPFTLGAKWRIGLTMLPLIGATLAALWQLWRLFGEYLRGNVFGPKALGCLQRFSRLLVVLAVLQPLTQTLMSVAVSWDNPPGQRSLVVSVGSGDFAMLLGALLFLAISRVMVEAARAADENQGFV